MFVKKKKKKKSPLMCANKNFMTMIWYTYEYEWDKFINILLYGIFCVVSCDYVNIVLNLSTLIVYKI